MLHPCLITKTTNAFRRKIWKPLTASTENLCDELWRSQDSGVSESISESWGGFGIRVRGVRVESTFADE